MGRIPIPRYISPLMLSLMVCSHITKFSPIFLPSATKVMFLQVSVCPRGMVSQHALQQVSRGVSAPGGPLRGGGCLLRGDVCVETPPPPKQTATVANGTHPTGMHSCTFKYRSVILSIMGDKPIQPVIQPVTIDTMLH